MHGKHFVAFSIKICDYLASSAKRFLRARRGRMAIFHHLPDELTVCRTGPVIPLLEFLAQLAGADTDFEKRGLYA